MGESSKIEKIVQVIEIIYSGMSSNGSSRGTVVVAYQLNRDLATARLTLASH